MVPAPLKRRHEAVDAELAFVSERVNEAVFRYCDRNGFAYVGRRKTLESIAEKIETGRYERWSDLDDLFACAIVIPTLDLESSVLDFLRGAFIESQTKRRGETEKSPEEFRFDSTRFYGRLRPTVPESEPPSPYRVLFEVQIRSAFEHAWQVTTHAVYKGRKVDWKIDRLVAQLKASVEQLDALVSTLETSSEAIVEHTHPRTSAKKMIAEAFGNLAFEGLIDEVLIPKDWSRFADNVYSILADVFRTDRRRIPAKIEETVLHIRSRVVGSSETIPLSISLLQFVFAEMTTTGILGRPFRFNRYIPFITEDLLSIYPDLRPNGFGFLIDE